MNPHVLLLTILMGSSTCESSTPANMAINSRQPQQHLLCLSYARSSAAHRWEHGKSALCAYRSPPGTTMNARQGGGKRRRGLANGTGTGTGVAVSAVNSSITERRSAVSEAVLAVQHATTEDELLTVAHSHREMLRPGVLSQALLRIAKPLVQVAKRAAREKFIKDPRLLDLFMAASAPAAAMQDRSDAQSPRSKGGVVAYTSDDRPLLSGAQAADIVWACGLLQWLPDEGDRLEHLLKLIALAAASPSGIDGWHATNAVWALDRLGGFAPEMARAGLCRGHKAVEELHEKVASLPFRAIPSIFEGLRVEDFRNEVDFGRDEILLGGGKVLSESRLTAWQSSDGLPFAYSGKVMEPKPFSPNVLRLRDALFERTGVLYDGVLLNLYESSSSAMRYHSDPDVGTVWTQDTSVVSVGDTRQFVLRETLDYSRRHNFYLFSGDCVRMTAGCQRDYQHCIKLATEDVGPRISLVFKQSIRLNKSRAKS